MQTLKPKNNRPVSVAFADGLRPAAVLPRVDHHIARGNGWVKTGELKHLKIGKSQFTTSALNRTFLLIGASSGASYATTRLMANNGNEIFSVSRVALPADLTEKTSHYQQKVKKNGGAGSTSPYQPPYGWVYFPGATLLRRFNHVKGDPAVLKKLPYL